MLLASFKIVGAHNTAKEWFQAFGYWTAKKFEVFDILKPKARFKLGPVRTLLSRGQDQSVGMTCLQFKA